MPHIIKLNVDNFSDALQNVQNVDGLAVVYFSATWCEPCKNMAPVFQQFAQEGHEIDIFFR